MATCVWLDCDPGHDDMMAIILAGHNPNIKLLGISTVAGNQTVEKTTQNACNVVSISGLENLDIVSGQAVPLIRPSIICPEIHGNSGLDCETGFPPTNKKPLNKKAILHIYEKISGKSQLSFSLIFSECNGNVTLVATGCLTNYALLFSVFPEVKKCISQLVLLGGAMDPEAAKIVFESGVKIVMVPLEVSHTALVTPQIIKRIEEFGSPFGHLMIDLLTFFAKSYKEVFGFDFPPLHDPLAVAYVIDPSIFHTVLMRVDIETSSPLTAGRTVCDVFQMSKERKNVHVAQKVDVEAFWNLLIAALKSADSISSMNKKN